MSIARKFWKIFHCHICGGNVKAQLYCPSCGHSFCRNCPREVVAEENITKVVTSSQALNPSQSVEPIPSTVKLPIPTETSIKEYSGPDSVTDGRPAIISSTASDTTPTNDQTGAAGKRESVVSINNFHPFDIFSGMAKAQCPAEVRLYCHSLAPVQLWHMALPTEE